MSTPVVRISHKGASRIQSGHPWVFSSDVEDRGDAAAGDVVRVAGPGGRALGVAHYSSTSQISLRLLSARQEPIDRAFFLRRLKAADALRRRVVSASNAWRVAHAEADGLPGLIVDRYGDYLVMQTLDQGMERAVDTLVDCLRELYSPAGIVLRNDALVRERESLAREVKVTFGEVPERVPIEMNGLRLEADLVRGQKTGVYLDQRENYLAAARYASGRALDCFTSTGGFALHMAVSCESVAGVDSSAAALGIARTNAAANAISNVQFQEADGFEFLAGIARTFETIVLDPPAFAKNRRSVDAALAGYKEINLRALRRLEPGGILVTCSCSHHVSEADFLAVVAAAALDAGKTLRVLERRTQAQDHPILLTVPETHYLKCLILQVVEG